MAGIKKKTNDIESTLHSRWGDEGISAPNDRAWIDVPVPRTQETSNKKTLNYFKRWSRGRKAAAPVRENNAERRPPQPLRLEENVIPHHPLLEAHWVRRPSDIERGITPPSIERPPTASNGHYERGRSREGLRTAHQRCSSEVVRPGRSMSRTRSPRRTASETRGSQSRSSSLRRPSSRASVMNPPARAPSIGPTMAQPVHPRTSFDRTTSPETTLTDTIASHRSSSGTSATSVSQSPPLQSAKKLSLLPSIVAKTPLPSQQQNSKPSAARVRKSHAGPQELVPSYDELWGA
ncbi:hypothetical protein VTN49DRAFT_4065 [Thermomyces lanuginosus]|uniref:uncharacterized protein n=1 Tax=Thermomyces lanuginosus TaxID=5541 RepID=UPI003742920E